MLRSYYFMSAACLGCEARERLAYISVTQTFQRAIAQLPHALASHAEHSPDLFQRVLTSAVQTEVQPQHFGIAALQRIERLLDLVGQEAIHRLIFRVRQILGDEALDERAITIGIERGVEPHVAGVERGERLHDLERQLRRVGDLFRRRLSTQRLPEILGSAHDAGQIRGPIQRHAHRTALPRECGENRLANPPHGVRDELDALIGIELARRREQTDVALADEIGERQAAILVLLGDGNHEAQVALYQLLHRLLIARANLPGERDLLLLRQQRSLGDLVEVLIEDVALVLVMAQTREQAAAPATALHDASLSRRDGRGLRLSLRSRSGFCLLTSTRHGSPY